MTKATDILAAKVTATKTPPHLIIEALAGTGKTTTLIEGIKVMGGTKDPTFVPSPQQSDIWEEMQLTPSNTTKCFVAFNKTIAEELKKRVPKGCDAMTMHSMGVKAVSSALGWRRLNNFRVDDIIAELLGVDNVTLRHRYFELVRATKKLVSLSKANLLGMPVVFDTETTMKESGCGFDLDYVTPDELEKLASHYNVEMNGCRERVFDLVPRVMERCLDVISDGCIDYDDMVWLPVALNLTLWRYDLLLVDEVQDLNRCQQALAKKAGKRLILCGDSRQAIYGFAGADAESMDNMKKELQGSKQGCVVLPLTVTRRCSKAVVEEAKKIVSTFEAHESNADGSVAKMSYTEEFEGHEDNPSDTKITYIDRVKQGDMILCRVNAPLVSQCFRFIRDGRKARIQGRDIGRGLISTIKKTKAETIVELVGSLSHWVDVEVKKEQSKRHPNESKLINLNDRHDCLSCFIDGAKTVSEVIAKIEKVFTDNKEEGTILLSSIHKAKGLEAKRVFLLQPKGAQMPHPMAKSQWQVVQEYNCLYIAITRAIEELVYVS